MNCSRTKRIGRLTIEVQWPIKGDYGLKDGFALPSIVLVSMDEGEISMVFGLFWFLLMFHFRYK